MKNMLVSCLLFLTGVLPSTVHADCEDYPPIGMKPEYTYTGPYENYAYGYAVTIPDGIIGGLFQDPDAPQHGIRIMLSWSPRATITFQGSANSLEDNDGKPLSSRGYSERSSHDPDYIQRSGREIKSTRTQGSKLGPFNGHSCVTEFLCSNRPDPQVIEYIVAIPPERGLVYEFVLETTRDRYEADRKTFMNLVSSFRLIQWR